MKYLVLLYGDEAAGAEPESPEFYAELAQYEAFERLAKDSIVTGEALEPVATTRTVRHDGAAVQVTDGPFTETVEVLGGYYVLEAPTLDDLLELARQIPAVETGIVEARPMVEWVEGPGFGKPVEGHRALVTIHGPETGEETPGTAGWEAGVGQHARFGESAGSHLLAAAAVHPTTTATTLRRRDGELLVTDGPFPETTEVVGGFYLLGGTDEEVIDLAGSVPVPDDGWVEVRPVMELGD